MSIGTCPITMSIGRKGATCLITMSIGDRGDYFVKEGEERDTTKASFCNTMVDTSAFVNGFAAEVTIVARTYFGSCEIKVCCQICDTEEETWHD